MSVVLFRDVQQTRVSLIEDCVHGLGVTTKGPTDHSSNDKTNVLQAAFDLACNELCIGETDELSRERVASMMLAFAKYGRLDVEKLKTFAVQQFQ